VDVLRFTRQGIHLMTFSVPWAPSTNTYWRHVGHKVLISAAGRAYRENVVARLFGVCKKMHQGPLKLTLVLHRPDMRRRDIDNVLKALLDSLTHAGVYADDSQIEHLDVRFAPLPLTEKRGTVDVSVEPLPGFVEPDAKPKKKGRKNPPRLPSSE